MNGENVISRIEEEVRRRMEGREGSHDFQHVKRVQSLALKLGEEVAADRYIVSLTALVHDLYDWKIYPDHEERLEGFLEEMGVEEKVRVRVLQIVEEISFRGESRRPESVEGQVLQDADRLDALGAIGVARAFSFGGSMGRPYLDPETLPPPAETDTYHPENFVKLSLEEKLRWLRGIKRSDTTIFHFYEKLLLLPHYMNTETGRRMAEERVEFMVEFLKRFFSEWGGGPGEQ